MTVTKPKTAEDLLTVLAELIQEFNNPDELDDVEDVAQGIDGDAGVVVAVDGHPAPWGDLAGIPAETNLLFKMPPDVVAKMNWVIDNVPRMNKQRIVRDGVYAELDRLMAQHHKPA
jgi:hypothetical protein